VAIVVRDVLFDRARQFFHASERSSSYRAPGDEIEPDFDLVEPGSVCRRMVYMPSVMDGQPSSHCRMLVRGRTVCERMDAQSLGDVFINVLEKARIVLMPVLVFPPRRNLPVGEVQSSEQLPGAGPFIVVRDAFDATGTHGEHGLGTLKRLDPTLFINTEHDGNLGRTHVPTDSIADLLSKERISRKFAMPLPMRLETKGLPDSVHRRS